MQLRICFVPVLTLALGSLTLSQAAWSQTGTIIPGQIEKQFKPEPTLRSRPKDIPTPRIRRQIPKGAEKVRFVLKSLEITGLEVYSTSDLASYFEPMLNQEISLKDIFVLAESITARYRTDGYIVSRVIVPAQSIKAGKVVLQAVEGFISDVRFVSLPDDREALVKAYAGKIKDVRPLTAAVLERYMLLVNDLPGVFANATMSPSETVFGAADLTVQVSQRQISAGIGYDNQGGRAIGPGRVNTNVELYNVLGLHERTAVLVATTLNEELRYYSVHHEQQIGTEGGKLLVGANFVRAEPEDLSAIIVNIETSSDTYFLTYTHPVLRSRAQNVYLRANFSSHDGETDLLGIRLNKDHLRVLRFGLAYDLVDSFGGVNLVDIELSQGLNALGSSDNGDPALSASNGKVDFTKLYLYAARLQDVAPHWSFLTALNGQYAFDDLLTSELFAYGGPLFGRGYDPSEFVGDNGLAAKIELRYDNSIPAKSQLPFTAYAFYDVGWIWQRTGASLEDTKAISSAGLGIRLSLGRYLAGFAEAAKPLSRDVAAEGDRDWRGYLGLTVSF